jgi:hypothetical protein
MPKDKVKGRAPKPTSQTQQAIASALPWMLGLPAQLRLSAREAKPVPPKKPKGGKR